jgi:hypothetical protein
MQHAWDRVEFWSENMKRTEHIQDIGSDEWDLKETRWKSVKLIHFAWGQEPAEVSCEYGNKPSGSTKGGEYFDLLSD